MPALAMIAMLSTPLWAAHSAAQAHAVELEAVLGNTAVLMIDGERKTLRAGQSHGGITLISVQPTTATLVTDGQTQTVGLSQRVSTRYAQPAETVVTIARDAAMQYLTTATINGRRVLVLVDTGANSVAISSEQARAMGIDYSDGMPARAETAGGTTTAYEITLQSIDVGGIEVHHVPAVVLEGAYPGQILLGMSYLRHVRIQEQNGVLSLSSSH